MPGHVNRFSQCTRDCFFGMPCIMFGSVRGAGEAITGKVISVVSYQDELRRETVNHFNCCVSSFVIRRLFESCATTHYFIQILFSSSSPPFGYYSPLGSSHLAGLTEYPRGLDTACAKVRGCGGPVRPTGFEHSFQSAIPSRVGGLHDFGRSSVRHTECVSQRAPSFPSPKYDR